MEYKKCGTCKILKLTTEFNKRVTSKDGFQSQCKQCQKEYHKKRDEDNLEYYQRNRERKLKYEKERRKNNPEYRKEWYINNSESQKAYQRKYKKVYNKLEYVKNKRNKKAKERRRNNPTYKLNQIMSGAIRASLKDGKDGKPWEKLVGYTLNDLKKHLEKQFTKGMTWSNHGRGKDKWHIDHHPIPLSWFVFKSYKDKGFRKAWAFENLRPMWSGSNMAKGNKLFYP